MNKISSVALRALLVVALPGCAINYDEGEISEERPEDVPSIVLVDASYTVVRSETNLYRIETQHAEIFPDLGYQQFRGFSFVEIDDEDDTSLNRGSADTLVHHFETDDVELDGGIDFYSADQEASIRAEYLYWDEENRHLRGRDNEVVEVERDSGSQVRGRGLLADMRRRVIEFASSVTGVIVTEEQESPTEAQPEAPPEGHVEAPPEEQVEPSTEAAAEKPLEEQPTEQIEELPADSIDK